MLAIGMMLVALAVPQARGEDDRIARLINRIATGDAQAAEDATDELLRRTVEPISAAIGPMSQRPQSEQLRLRRMLVRLSARLRLALFRAELTPAQRTMLDEFSLAHTELVEQLFDDNPAARLTAIQQIPVEPDTASGLLAVAKINDPDGDVVEAAIELTNSLQDRVVTEALLRFVTDSTAAIRAGYFRPGEQELAANLVALVGQAIRQIGVIAEAHPEYARDAAPPLLEALRYYPGTAFRAVFFPAEVAEALGKVGDVRAAPALLELLESREIAANMALGGGKLITQTMGDVAHLALLRLFKVDPQEYGFEVGPEPRKVTGFLEQDSRDAARKKLRIWYKEQVEARVAAASSQPVSGERRP
ncbi:MAG: hypothetical protein CHACPFDD_02318 [Phycisphaerae bacterium]|nr:hypothetical protein [Phycisphaerae bacterium]